MVWCCILKDVSESPSLEKLAHGSGNFDLFTGKSSKQHASTCLGVRSSAAVKFWKAMVEVDLALCYSRSFEVFGKIVYPLVNIQKAIENGPVEIVDFPIKNGGSFHCYVSSPEGTPCNSMVVHPFPNNRYINWGSVPPFFGPGSDLPMVTGECNMNHSGAFCSPFSCAVVFETLGIWEFLEFLDEFEMEVSKVKGVAQ